MRGGKLRIKGRCRAEVLDVLARNGVAPAGIVDRDDGDVTIEMPVLDPALLTAILDEVRRECFALQATVRS
jgi:hypothetical protein